MISDRPVNTTSAPLVAPLGRFTRRDVPLAGGKGANLGELIKAGFAVPPGFVVTTTAYDLALQNDDLRKVLDQAINLLKPDEPASITQVSDQIGDRLKNMSLPGQVSDEILKAYRELGGGPVAVRSSATAEDLPDAAFAGQQETFLNVIGEDSLLESVRGCWASLWSERAISYRSRQKVDQTTIKIAVVVQQMVAADSAGVMFTANPVSGDKGELVVDASPGLGEAVVSGIVTPDHYVIDKQHKRIREKRIGRREVIIRSKAGGGTEQTSPDPQAANAPVLSRKALLQLAGVGIAIERHFGSPQDIEWALVKDGTETGKLLILQARPITALPEAVKISSATRRLIPILAEMWPSRPYPLDVTTFTGAVERAIGHLLVTLIGKAAPDPEKVLVEEDGVVVRFNPPQVPPSPGILVMPLLALWRTRHYDPSHWASDPLLAEAIAQARELEHRDLHTLSWSDVIETLHEALGLVARFMQIREHYFPKSLLALAGLWLLLSITRHSDRFGAMVSGVETKTAETNRALEGLALKIRRNLALSDLFARRDAHELVSALQDSEAGRGFLQDLHSFLAEYGHRETSLTISEGAWQDRPEVVLGILKVLSLSDAQEPAGGQDWQKARDELLKSSLLGRWPLRGVFLNALTNGRALFQLREDSHFYATLVLPVVRRAALELGRRLFEAKTLASPDDVFHLRLDELEKLAKSWPPPEEEQARIRAMVARRQAKRESLANKPMVDPRLLETPAREVISKDVLLTGSPGSPGVASGPARIIRDSSQFGNLRVGDVLVAPATNPAWTPLFQRAAAVIVDTGGSASHAAIVAREYGVPAVMGTVTGTRHLTDGEWVKVDGSRGLVLKAERPK